MKLEDINVRKIKGGWDVVNRHTEKCLCYPKTRKSSALAFMEGYILGYEQSKKDGK